MSEKKEPWKRTTITMATRLLAYLEKFPTAHSQSIELCIEYASKTDFLKTLTGLSLETPYTCHNCKHPILVDQSYGTCGTTRWHLDPRTECTGIFIDVSQPEHIVNKPEEFNIFAALEDQ